MLHLPQQLLSMRQDVHQRLVPLGPSHREGQRGHRGQHGVRVHLVRIQPAVLRRLHLEPLQRPAVGVALLQAMGTAAARSLPITWRNSKKLPMNKHVDLEFGR